MSQSQFKDVSIGVDGATWGITSESHPARYLGNGEWAIVETPQEVLNLSEISVGSWNQVYASDRNGGFYYRINPDPNGPSEFGWEQQFSVPGQLGFEATFDGGVWVIDAGNVPQLFVQGVNQNIAPADNSPRLISIGAVSKEEAWGISTNGSLYQFTGGVWYARTNVNFVQITAGADGTVFALDPTYIAYKMVNGDVNNWQNMGGGLTDISCGNAKLICGISENLPVQLNPDENAWQSYSISAQDLSVSLNGRVMLVNSTNDIYEYTGENAWTRVAGSLSGISVAGDYEVWGIQNGKVVRQVGEDWISLTDYISSEFAKVSIGADMYAIGNYVGATGIAQFKEKESSVGLIDNSGISYSQVFRDISVGTSEHIYGIGSNGALYQYANNSWNEIDGSKDLATVSATAGGEVFLTDTDFNVYRLNKDINSLETIPGRFKQIAAGNEAEVWGLDSTGMVYKRGGYSWGNLGNEVYGQSSASDSKMQSRSVESLSVTLPTLNEENLQIAITSATNMYNWTESYELDFIPKIEQCYNLMQAEDSNPRQTVADIVVKVGLGALSLADVPGAGVISAIINGYYQYAVSEDGSQDVHQTFATMWDLFSANTHALKSQIADIKTGLEAALSHAPNFTTTDVTLWSSSFYDSVSGEHSKVGEMATSPMPGIGTDYQTLLDDALNASEYELYKTVLPTQFASGKPTSWAGGQEFDKQSDCEAFMICWCNENPYFRLKIYTRESEGYSKDDVYALKYYWLGGSSSTGSMYGTHPSAALCNKLFKDDGAGNIVRPDALATRHEVFKEWYDETYTAKSSNPMEWYYPYYSECLSAFSLKVVRGAGADYPYEKKEAKDYSGLDYSGHDLAAVDFPGVNLSQANLSKANFSQAHIPGANLSGIDAKSIDLSGTKANFVNFSKANLSDSQMEKFSSWFANFQGANLSGANLKGARLRGADLRGANLKGADLSNADLTGANLDGADVTNADFSHAFIRSTSFVDAKTNGATFKHAYSPHAAGLELEVATPKMDRSLFDTYNPGEFDPIALSALTNGYANIIGSMPYSGYGNTIRTMKNAVANFGQVVLPLTNPNTSDYFQKYNVILGNAGQEFYQDGTNFLQNIGLPSNYYNGFKAVGQNSGYPAMGMCIEANNSTQSSGVWGSFQGPMNYSEACYLVNEVAGFNNQINYAQIQNKLADAMNSIGAANIAVSSLSLTYDSNPVSEFFLPIPAGNSTDLQSILTGMGLNWSETSVLEPIMAATMAGFMIGVGITSNGGVGISVYLPYSLSVANTLLQNSSQSTRDRFEAAADLATEGSQHISWMVASLNLSGETVYSIVTNLN